MIKKVFIAAALFCSAGFAAQAQKYSIVIKGGHVIHPKNNINSIMDVALKGDTVMLVAKNIDAKEGVQVVNAKGLFVTPGLIDMHSHNFFGTKMDQTYSNGPNAFLPTASHSAPALPPL